jgi:hypothetical protein
MQPGQIKVFDGLRITTEHIDHLQGSIHSAIGDVRAILGLARVHRGFEVTRLDPHAVQVDPGVAFDVERRRIVSDEPIRLELPPLEPDARLFVCVSYDQVADAEVEGQPTRIWDSCSASVRAEAPESPDPAIILAELVGVAGDGGFEVHRVTGTEPGAEEPAPAALPEAAPVVEGAGTQPVEPAARLGVERFDPGDAAALLGDKLAAALRARAAAPAEGPVLRERLATREVLVGLQFRSVATHATLTLAVGFPAAGSSGDAQPAAGAVCRVEASAHGHAISGESSVSQCSAGMAAVWDPLSGTARSAPTFAPEDVLRCSAVAGVPTDADSRLVFLAGLSVALRLARRNGDGFAIDAWLEWNGEPSEALATWMETSPPTVQWDASLGWATVGFPPP